MWPFLSRKSSIPFIGRNTKIIAPSKLNFGALCFVGQNSYVDAHSSSGILLCNNVTIREGATIQCRSGLGPIGIGLNIGSNTYIGPYCKIGVGGLINIGSNVQIGFCVSINSESHESDGHNYVSGVVSRVGVNISDSVWIGDGVVILDGVNIGTGAVIGAGSVVTKSVGIGEIVAGVPARKITYNQI